MKTILVYGDLMIDRTWIVTEPAATASLYENVKTLRRESPTRSDESLGGAGTIATTLAHFCSADASVHLLCYSGPIENKTRGNITLHQLPTSSDPITTIKFRVYIKDENGKPEFKYRFDQDAPAPVLTGNLPDLPQLDSIILSDFNKGTVQPQIINALLTKYPNTPWLVDSKNASLFQINPGLRSQGGTLFVNRKEAMSLWEVEATDSSEEPNIEGDLISCRSDLLKLGNSLMEKLPNWNVIVKLDKDGAFLFSGQEFAEFRTTPINAPGISAGDVFLSAWVQAQLHDSNLSLALKHATTTATEWVRFSDSIDSWKIAWNANREKPTSLDFSPKQPVSDSEDPVFQSVGNEL